MQVILWAVSGDKRLSPKGRDIFLDPENKLYFSVAGYWEIAIKVSIGKLRLCAQWPKIIQREVKRDMVVKSLQIPNSAFCQSRHSRSLLGGNPVISLCYGSPSPTKDLGDDALPRG